MTMLGNELPTLASSISSSIDSVQSAIPKIPDLSVHGIARTIQLLAISLNYTDPNWPESADVKYGDHFDFIIVGGGTAGLVMANRLTEIAEWNVLVVEAGGNPPLLGVIPGTFPFMAHTQQDWDFYTEYDNITSHALNYQKISAQRGKVLGGSSVINHLLYERGNPEDYNEWGALGNEGWSWEECLKYFNKLEGVIDDTIMKRPTSEYHCTNGPIAIKKQNLNRKLSKINDHLLDSFEEIGMKKLPDSNGLDQIGCSKQDLPINKNSATKSSTAQNYLLPVKDRKNLFILKESLVTKIIINDKLRAMGVMIKTTLGNTIQVNADIEVIISAGVYNTPKILQLSGVGPKADLLAFGIDVIADLPTGENLQDHAFVPMTITGADSVMTSVEAALSLLDLKTFPLPLVNGAFSLTENSTIPDIQHITSVGGAFSPLFFYLLLVNFNLNIVSTLSILESTLNKELVYSLVQLMKPESKGHVKIRSMNPEDPPKIYHNFLHTEEDLNKLAKGLKKMLTLKDTIYYKRMKSKIIYPVLKECADLDKTDDEYWRCYVKTTVSSTFHPTGTSKMAPKEKGGVVDNRLRVYDISGLRVVDDSIMPIQPCAKTAAPVMMIAEKAADMIKEDHGKTVEEFVCFTDI